MKRALSGLVLALAILSVSPHASADLAQHDPDDVGFRLDVRTLSSISSPDYLGIGVFFYEDVARRRQPKVRVLYDAFGSPAPDFALRFHYYRSGSYYALACDLVRLADRARLSVSPPDDQPDYMYCEFPRPGGMQARGGVRWRVAAVMPGVGKDRAPAVGWFPHP